MRAALRRAAVAAAAILWSLPAPAGAQPKPGLTPLDRVFVTPYAGKYEARIGGSRESANDKLRLDIGASVELLRAMPDIDLFVPSPPESDGANPLVPVMRPRSYLSLGADFFTWTRLRAAGGFKFPVEAVDYYFGVNGALQTPVGMGARLRIAHISAHLVDGDPSFADTATQYITYSREFADLTLSYDRLASETLPRRFGIRPYIGAQWLFHTIPDTLGRITPYAGFDARIQPWKRRVPLVLIVGYEARLNTELEPIGEHQFRLGAKLGTQDPVSTGVTVEGGYYSGRSPYGQHFWKREKYWSLGFTIDF